MEGQQSGLELGAGRVEVKRVTTTLSASLFHVPSFTNFLLTSTREETLITRNPYKNKARKKQGYKRRRGP